MTGYSQSAVFLLTGNEAPKDARYSRPESIEMRPLVPKGIFQFDKLEVKLLVEV